MANCKALTGSAVKGSLCCTQQCCCCNWLLNTRRWAGAKDRWPWREVWEKHGFKTRVENVMRNVNNRSRIKACNGEELVDDDAPDWIEHEEYGGILFHRWGAACSWSWDWWSWVGDLSRLISADDQVDQEGCTVTRSLR